MNLFFDSIISIYILVTAMELGVGVSGCGDLIKEKRKKMENKVPPICASWVTQSVSKKTNPFIFRF